MSGKYHRLVDRELRTAEKLLITALVEPRADNAKFLEQLERARVVAECTCGCPTVDLALNRESQRLVGPSKVVADLEATSPEGIRVGVVLHVRVDPATGEDQLSELEVYPLPEVDEVGLPSPAALDWKTQVADA